MANSNSTPTFSVGVIGAGVMGEALIAALLKFGVPATSILFTEKRQERADELVDRYGITSADLTNTVKSSDVILLVMKPQDMQSVLDEIKADIKDGALVVTFAAGKKIDFITQVLGTSHPVIRVMPNTPLLVGEGMSAISLGAGVSSDQRAFVRGFLEGTGRAIEVAEELQDAVTATSGSGPAYFFAFVEAMVSGATALGLSHADATTLTIQTIVGAAKLLDESEDSPTTLREKVTSPNGTTAAAIKSFDESSLQKIVAEAMKAAYVRSQELA